MAKALYNTYLPQTCGVGEIGQFRQNYHFDGVQIKYLEPKGGCGWVIASFTPALDVYEEAYKELRKKWKLIYQSPVRVNKRTQQQLFFCIFDSRIKP